MPRLYRRLNARRYRVRFSLSKQSHLVQSVDRSVLEDDSIFAARYRIVRRIASGGMGAVYEARHIETNRPCALKVMLPHVAENATSRERFRLEARAAALVSNPHVVEVLDAGVDETVGSPFLVMEFLCGEDLSRRVERIGPLPSTEVATFVNQAARGLDALHRASIVHRDLKPSNLFLAERDGYEPIVKVLDLGVAKRVAQTVATTAVVGTPIYMAPEQINNGKITAATDVYALGMVTYSLLVGREYWEKEAETATSSVAFALSILDGPTEPATARAATAGVVLPSAFDAWFCRATAPDPTTRFSGVLDAAVALHEALGIESNVLRSEHEVGLPSHENAVERAPKFDAFAPTMPELAPARPKTETISIRPEKGKQVTDTLPMVKRSRRWSVAALMIVTALAAGAIAVRKMQTPAAPALVKAIDCAPANVTGPGTVPGLADALGKGACARLGIELGVMWLEPHGTRLLVNAEIRADRSARVTLELAGQKAEAEGKTTIAATNAAIQKLAPTLTVPPMLPDRIAAWGAKDAASARRIERAMRTISFGFADRRSTAEKIVATDNDSPVPHAMLACAIRNDDRERALTEEKAARDRLSLMPAKRAQLVANGMSIFVSNASDKPYAQELMDSYSEQNDDPDFATLYTMCGCLLNDTSLPMIDRLAEHVRVMSLPMLRCAFWGTATNGERTKRYLEWMEATLPEMQSRHVLAFLHLGNVDAARAALAVGEALGNESMKRADFAANRSTIAMAAFEPRAALAAADELLGEPDLDVIDNGAYARMQALFLAGKIRDAEQTVDLQLSRIQRTERHESFLQLAAADLRMRRLLGRPAPTPERIREIEKQIPQVSMTNSLQAKVELASLRARESTATGTKADLDALLEGDDSNRWSRSYRLAYTLPIVRFVRGNEAAAAAYREISGQPRYTAAFEAALALEANGAKAEAEKAYRLCMEEPWYYPFEAIAARVRLVEIARANGRDDEARTLSEVVDKAWADADPDLRDIVRQLK